MFNIAFLSDVKQSNSPNDRDSINTIDSQIKKKMEIIQYNV